MTWAQIWEVSSVSLSHFAGAQTHLYNSPGTPHHTLTYRNGPQDEGHVSLDGEGVDTQEKAEDGQLHGDDECQERVDSGPREQYQ